MEICPFFQTIMLQANVAMRFWIFTSLIYLICQTWQPCVNFNRYEADNTHSAILGSQ